MDDDGFEGVKISQGKSNAATNLHLLGHIQRNRFITEDFTQASLGHVFGDDAEVGRSQTGTNEHDNVGVTHFAEQSGLRSEIEHLLLAQFLLDKFL